ncbi:MAG: hypothetical protein RR772_10130, partial [Gordonibacter sp.]
AADSEADDDPSLTPCPLCSDTCGDETGAAEYGSRAKALGVMATGIKRAQTSTIMMVACEKKRHKTRYGRLWLTLLIFIPFLDALPPATKAACP